MKCAIGIDLGGTNIRAGLVSEAGRVLAQTWRKTPVVEGPEATAQTMATMIVELRGGLSAGLVIEGVGIGSPGPLSRAQKKIFQSANLPGFAGFPLGTRVEELAQLKVCLDNDAKCATLGEGWVGVARGLKNYILMTFGTGIGAGVIIDGKMIYGKSDGACEIGHMTLHPNGELCACGNRGCFERYCSATAIERRAFKHVHRQVTCVDVLSAHSEGEKWAETFLREISLDLAIATASLVNIFDPNMIVFGGGVFSTGGGPLCEWVREEIRTRCFESSQKGISLVPSQLGGEAGMVGAASLILTSSLRDRHQQ